MNPLLLDYRQMQEKMYIMSADSIPHSNEDSFFLFILNPS